MNTDFHGRFFWPSSDAATIDRLGWIWQDEQTTGIRGRRRHPLRTKERVGLRPLPLESGYRKQERGDCITGVEFTRPVKHKTGEPLKTIYHMQVGTVLPLAVQTDELKTEKCEMPTDPAMIKVLTAIKSSLLKGPFCGAVKYNYPQAEDVPVAMGASAFVSAPEVVRMNEWFGSGGSAGRPVLISQRVKDIVDAMKWRGLTFSPIKIVNE